MSDSPSQQGESPCASAEQNRNEDGKGQQEDNAGALVTILQDAEGAEAVEQAKKGPGPGPIRHPGPDEGQEQRQVGADPEGDEYRATTGKGVTYGDEDCW
jgi:hypothetical protein